jgi:hypothetical protein
MFQQYSELNSKFNYFLHLSIIAVFTRYHFFLYINIEFDEN